MAIYSLSIKPASRGAGQNALAMAAYRSGGRLIDQRTGEIKDYSRKTGITYTGIFYPAGVSFSRQELWNMAEKAERRKDSRIAREILLALPHELPAEKRTELAKNFAQNLVKKYGIAVDLSLHDPDKNGDKRNFHAHLLLTTRQINKEGFTEKSDLEREDKYLRQNGKKNGREQIEEIRQEWENRCNIALKREGRGERISAKSYHARNIARVPTIHLGKSATVLERRGIPTEKGNINRAIKNHNRILYLRWKRNRAIREIQQLDNEIRALQQTPREMPGEEEQRPATVSDLLEKSATQKNERGGEHAKNISVSDLLNRVKDKEKEGITRNKDGLER